jgi:hypothetical protein
MISSPAGIVCSRVYRTPRLRIFMIPITFSVYLCTPVTALLQAHVRAAPMAGLPALPHLHPIGGNRTRRSRKKYFVHPVLRTQLKVTDDYGTCLVKCSCHDRVCASNRRGMDPRLCTCARGCRFSNQRNLPLAYNLGQPHPYLSPCESSQERAILDNASSRKAYQSRSIPRRWTALLNRRNAPPP